MNKMVEKNKKDIVRQIHSMVTADRKEMKKAEQGGAWNKWLDIAKENAEKLKIIIKEHGWPTISKFGKQASRGTWFITQHADHDLSFQKQALRLMEEAAAKKSTAILKPNLAFLRDRVLVNQGKKQLYGTQFYLNKSGKFVPRPIQDLKNVDERRTKFGLPALQDYIESAKKYKPRRKRL